MIDIKLLENKLKELGLSKVEFAKAIGVSKSCVYNLSNQVNPPSYYMIIESITVLNLSIEECIRIYFPFLITKFQELLKRASEETDNTEE